MPAKYSHRKTSEQISAGGRSAWKQPEPRTVQEKKIFGYEVDSTTFQKYNHQNYTIGFAFCNLEAVERWATDPDRAAKFPENATEAKKIVGQIIAEITGKDINTMSKPKTAAEFIAALNDIYTGSRTAYEELQAKVNAAQADMDKAYEDTKAPGANEAIAQARYSIAKGELTLAKDNARNGRRKLMAEHEQKVKDLRNQFTEYLNGKYAASPDALDNATMMLLNSGICTPSELSRLIDRHQDNPTMLRIVGNYARKMRDENKALSYEDQKICSNVVHRAAAAKNGDRELSIFDSAVNAAAYGLDKDYGHATRMHSHVAGWLDGFKEQISNLAMMPAEPNAE